MKLKAANSEVYFSKGSVVTMGRREIQFLAKQAIRNPRRRARLCAHENLTDKVQEMLIVLARGAYIRPHTHDKKEESFHVVQGRIDVVTFDKRGKITEIIPLGDFKSGLPFFYRLRDARYHTVVVKTPIAVFHETTNGPFRQGKSSLFAPWSPTDMELEKIVEFQRKMSRAR